MPPRTTESKINKYRSLIKDIILIVGFLSTAIGWVVSETVKKTELKDEVRHLSIIIEDQAKQLEKVNDILMDQKELNGKIIQYMQE